MALSTFRLDGAALARELRGPTGSVARYQLVVGDRVKKGAQRRVGKDSRQLERSIVKRPKAGAGGMVVSVGSFQGGVGYAWYHHQGTAPHSITPRSASVLRFEVDGAIVFTAHVNHPGTRPNRYLVDAAEDLGLDVEIGR